MAIPKFTKDIEVIQKLSDLPNTTDGLTADQLKAKFDEAAKMVKAFLNDELIPAIAARQIPFEKTMEISAETIQDAIIAVQKQIQDAASGTIVNGSVTREKLSAELLARVYGGRPWVSVKTPDSGDNMAADFPIGQVWLRPSFDVVNARGTNWTASGCIVAAETQKVTLTGNNTVSTATMTQSLTGIGLENDLVYILFDVTEQDPEITDLTMAVNGESAESISASVSKSAQLMVNGSLMLEIAATWPSTSLANGTVVLENLAIVNVSQIMRQLTDAQEMTDWVEYLRSLLPLETYRSPAEVYMQATDGYWLSLGFDVTPVTRGGTGLSTVSKGQMIYADNDNSLKALDPPEEQNSMLVYDTTPQWKTPEQVAAFLNQLKLTTGTYTGTATERSLELPVTPKLLHIFPVSGIDNSIFSSSTDWTLGDALPVVLADGAEAAQVRKASYKTSDGESYVGTWSAKVGLSGKALTFSKVGGISGVLKADYMNRSGVTYRWTAIY